MAQECFSVIGIVVNSFTDKSTGEVVAYGQLHTLALEAQEDKHCVGQKVCILKVSPEIIKSSAVSCGDEVIPVYNKYGRIDDLTIIKK